KVTMGSDAVNVAMTSGERQKNRFLLNTRESAGRQQDGSCNLCLGLDYARKQALRAEDGGHEAEVVAKRLVGRERLGQRRLRKEAHRRLRAVGLEHTVPARTRANAVGILSESLVIDPVGDAFGGY